MMNLKAQIQLLIDNAPQDGVTPQLVAKIAPVFSEIAQQLHHSQYYILQDLQQSWILTTLSHRDRPEVEKHVIYAFPTLQDAISRSDAGLDPQVMASPIPVTHILFQLTALEPVDSIVFFETSGDASSGIEIQRKYLQSLISKQLSCCAFNLHKQHFPCFLLFFPI